MHRITDVVVIGIENGIWIYEQTINQNDGILISNKYWTWK